MATNKKTTRESLLESKAKTLRLYKQYKIQEVFERITAREAEDLTHMFKLYTKIYGPEAIEFWMLAVFKHMRKSLVNAVNIEKIKHLAMQATLWDLDITIIDKKTNKERVLTINDRVKDLN
jgi:rubrerythrin